MEPNKDKKPEKRSVRFIEGKGFYIALVLCAAVIGVSAWSLLSGTKTMDSEHDQNTVLEVGRDLGRRDVVRHVLRRLG